jgi:molybdopterin-guanine dinucleotide biosynthesis protein B
VVGQSGSGKTHLLEGVIPELKHRGYKVATVKHDVHGFEIDRPGKDSWRQAQAGADAVMISSPRKWALIRRVESELSLEEIQRLLQGVDIILTEGYSGESAPKIEVLARESRRPMYQGRSLIALVGKIGRDCGIPCFGRDDFAGVADFIEQGFLIKTGGGEMSDDSN